MLRREVDRNRILIFLYRTDLLAGNEALNGLNRLRVTQEVRQGSPEGVPQG